MPQLFLFNYSTRQLHGVYVRDGPPTMNLEPQAWAHHRKPGDRRDVSPYPAQVRWRELRSCRAIREDLWKHVPATKPGGKGNKPHYKSERRQRYQRCQRCQRCHALERQCYEGVAYGPAATRSLPFVPKATPGTPPHSARAVPSLDRPPAVWMTGEQAQQLAELCMRHG